MARPTDCTPAVTAQVCKAIAMGAPLRTAAASAGLAASTFHDWMKRGARGEAPFSEFSERIEKAQADYFLGLAAIVSGHAFTKKDARVALSILARRQTEDWGRTQRLEHSGPGGAPIQVEDARGEFLRLLDRRVPGADPGGGPDGDQGGGPGA